MKRCIAGALIAVIALTALPFVPATGAAGGSTIRMTVTVEGLEANDEAVLRIGVDDGSLQLSGQPIYEYTVRGVDGTAQEVGINPTLDDGRYLLVVDAPEKYFREPRGYLFMVYQAAVVNPAGHSVKFALIPPEARDYEPYRGPMMVPNSSAAVPTPGIGEVTYRVEAVASLSAPPKQPERIPASYWAGLWGGAIALVAAVGVAIFVIVRTITRLRERGRGGQRIGG